MPAEEKLNALKLLSEDHRRVEQLFEDFESAKGASAKQKIALEICTELKVHSLIEEELFYPALRGKIEDDILDEAYVEHDGAKVLINDIEAAEPDEEFYDAKVTVLQEQIEHHVREEEKQSNNMFQQARQTDVDMEALGEQMMARKQELLEKAKSGTLGPARPTTVETA